MLCSDLKTFLKIQGYIAFAQIFCTVKQLSKSFFQTKILPIYNILKHGREFLFKEKCQLDVDLAIYILRRTTSSDPDLQMVKSKGNFKRKINLIRIDCSKRVTLRAVS